ncbi:MAG: HesB/IscA family protein [Candidatus Binatia bacterium]
MMIITDEAAERIRSLVEGSSNHADGLRVKVVGGGCSGLQYKIELDQRRKGDKVFEHEGARLYVDRKSYLYVVGTEVDFSEGLMNAGFNLNNPNVKSSCGCGESFVV